MTKQCGTCVSRRINGGLNEKGCLKCSLGLDKYLGENEVCGSYAQNDIPMNDYDFEYEGIHIDELNEKWLSGEYI